MDIHVMHSNSYKKVLIFTIAHLSPFLKVSLTICKGSETSMFYAVTFQSGHIFWDIPNWKDENMGNVLKSCLYAGFELHAFGQAFILHLSLISLFLHLVGVMKN